MANPKPLVHVACLCERVLQEKDNVFSLVRVVDTYTVSTPPPTAPPDMKHAIELNVFISLKSGDFIGESDVWLVLHYPSEKTKQLPKTKMVFTGNESGSTFMGKLVLEVKEYGLYGFDVVWDDEVLTRIPFKLVSGPPPGEKEPELS